MAETTARRVLITEQAVQLTLTLEDAKLLRDELGLAPSLKDREFANKIWGQLHNAIRSCS